jgi:hypothetical protein
VSDLATPTELVPPWLASMFTVIWKGPSPSKVTAFAWQLLHNRIPTRQNLHHRNIIDLVGDQSCVLCGERLETTLHLFIYCDTASMIWKGVFDWLEIPLVFPHKLFSLLQQLIQVRGKVLKKGMGMIWKAVVWSLWRHRNSVMFENGRRDPAWVLEEVKVSTWKWWINQDKAASSLFYEWRVQPKLCMMQ